MQQLYDYPLKKHNSWHLESKATCAYQPSEEKDLQAIIDQHGTFGLWLGLGSNVLLPEVVSQPVVLMQKFFNQMHWIDEHTLYLQAGMTCAKAAKTCAKKGFKDAVFFAGIPGTIGGALMMNAGAFGYETWQYVQYVDVIDQEGIIHRCEPKAFTIHYRHIETPFPLRFIGAAFKFDSSSPEMAQTHMKSCVTKRNASQPIGTFNCGSVFKNPYPNHAAKLIEGCGLKGYTHQGAQISPKHANFIINLGDATYTGILELMQHIQSHVEATYAIHLEAEVIIVARD